MFCGVITPGAYVESSGARRGQKSAIYVIREEPEGYFSMSAKRPAECNITFDRIQCCLIENLARMRERAGPTPRCCSGTLASTHHSQRGTFDCVSAFNFRCDRNAGNNAVTRPEMPAYEETPTFTVTLFSPSRFRHLLLSGRKVRNRVDEERSLPIRPVSALGDDVQGGCRTSTQPKTFRDGNLPTHNNCRDCHAMLPWSRT